MPDRILVAYATKTGSTAEVAAAIGAALRAELGVGCEVDVQNVAHVNDLSPYSAVVIGAAARMSRLLPQALSFAKAHRDALAHKTTAYFTVCATMKEDTPERRDLAAGFLQPLVQIKAPVSAGLFAGNIDPARLELPWSLIVRLSKSGMMAAGDFRQWDLIRVWAHDLAPLLRGR